jgi:hypothetical protein
MPQVELLYQRYEYLLVVALCALLLIAAEAGFRRGCALQARSDDATEKPQLAVLQSSVLGILALLLGFTLAMALSRFETRSQLAVAEANAIGTTHLRSQMLGEPTRSSVEHSLRQYIDARLELYDAKLDWRAIAADTSRQERLLDDLWAAAIGAARQDPHSIPAGLFISSLNEVIDVQVKRDAATRNHVPESVLLLLVLVAIGALGLIGYGCGLVNDRHFGQVVITSIVIALVILTIIDLDRPRRGLIQISQRSMMELHDSLQANPH